MSSNLDLRPAPNSRFVRKRVGRGHGSGNGKTAGKGHKGQKARSGGSIRWGFEGGQMPLQRRVPKRGFRNKFAKVVSTVNLSVLNDRFDDGASIDARALVSAGLVKGRFDKLKILGNGELTKKFEISANMFSMTAKEKIEKSGGVAKVVMKYAKNVKASVEDR